MSSNNEDYFCYQCSKKYPDFSKYHAHIKMKHRDNKQPQKINLNSDELLEVQDQIYTYFGELSETYAQNARASEPQNLLQEHRFIGQANYIPNFIVRTPYQTEINVTNQIPVNYKFEPIIKISLSKQEIQKTISQIAAEIKQLYKKLEEERNFWEFADPYDTTIDIQDQFSVLDVYKLIRNYPKRNIHLKIPELSIFIVWIARICKPEMFKLVYEILVSFILVYEDFLKSQKIGKSGRKNLNNWEKFEQKQKQLLKQSDYFEKDPSKQVLRYFELKLNVNKIEVSKLDKLIVLYQKWTKTVLPAFSMEKKGSKPEEN